MNATYHGVVRGGIVLLDHGAPLAEGTEVNVTPVAKPRGNGPDIIAALAASPPVPQEWADELMRIIEEGQRPPVHEDIFPDEVDVKEND